MSAIETAVWQNPLPAGFDANLSMVFNSLTAWLLKNWQPSSATAPLGQFDLWDYGTNDKVLAMDVATNGTAITSASLTAAHKGLAIVIDGAGPSGGVLVTSLLDASAGSGTLATASSVSVSGACAVWGSDDTAAWNKMASDCYNAGGGCMKWSGITLLLGQFVLPNDGNVAAPTNGAGPPNTPQLVGPWQPPMRVAGTGAYWDGQWGGSFRPRDGSLMVCASTTAPAAVVSEGAGSLEIDHFAALMLAPDGVAFYRATNTTTVAHDGATRGRPSKYQATCTQEAFSFGGSSTQVTADSNGMFQGYGTIVRDWYFDRICHAVTDGSSANSLTLINNSVSLTCGSGTSGDAPIVLGNGTLAHWIQGFIPEMAGYANGYAVKLNSGNTNCFLIGIGTVDAKNNTSGVVYCGPGSENNFLVAGYRDNPGVPFVVEDTSVAARNRIDSSFDYDKGYLDMDLSADQPVGTGTVVVWNNYRGGGQADSDPGSLMDVSSGVATIKTPGLYTINWQLCFSSGGSGYQVGSNLFVNGYLQNLGGRFAPGTAQAYANGHAILRLQGGDTVSVQAYAFSGSDTLLAANTVLTMARVA